MTATLFDVDAALFAALSALQTTDPAGPTAVAPFALVGRHAGPVTKASLAHVAAQYPCALLRRDDESSTNLVRTFGGYTEDRATSTWSVIVACEDPRAVDQGVQGDAAMPGLTRLVDVVQGALDGLAIPGLFAEQPVRYTGTRHELIDLGVVYADAVAFEVWRVVPQATNPDPGASLPYVQPIVGDLLLEGTVDPAPDPFLVLEADPNP